MRISTVGKNSSIISAAMLSLLLLAALLPFSQPVSGATSTINQPVLAQAGAQIFNNTVLAPPDAKIAQEADGTVVLSWNALATAASFNVYRSTTQGLNYTLRDTVMANQYQMKYSFKDEGLTNQNTYYYVVTTVNRQGVESSFSNELAAMPHLVITWAGTVLPKVTEHVMGAPAPLSITGKVNIKEYTGAPGPAVGVIAQLGYGPVGTPPNTWTHWMPASYAGKPVDETPVANDLYQTIFRPHAAGAYNYVFRFSSTLGREWVYAGLKVPANPALPASDENEMGLMTITGSSDTTKPTAPGSLTLQEVTKRSARMSWTASTDNNAVYRYDIMRSNNSGGPYELAGSLPADASKLEYTDDQLIAGTTYYYVVQAVDTSFNRSDNSNQISAQTEVSLVDVTVRVTVPSFTVGKVYINRVVNPNGSLGGTNWMGTELSPGGGANTYQATLRLLEGTPVSFRFSRGSQSTVQTNADGNTPAPAPDFVVTAGQTQIQRAVLNWDDPLVIAHWPDSTLVQMTAPISVTWNQPMPVSTRFIVRDITDSTPQVLDGDFTYIANTRSTHFLIKGSFPANRVYQVEVSGQTDLNGLAQVVPMTWTFESDIYQMYMPILQR